MNGQAKRAYPFHFLDSTLPIETININSLWKSFCSAIHDPKTNIVKQSHSALKFFKRGKRF